MRHALPAVLLAAGIAGSGAAAAVPASPQEPGSATEAMASRPNVLLLTVDDMDAFSLGVTGSRVPGVSPHLDRLASEGVRFERAHVAIAICQPCRATILTGRYPTTNGALGFDPIAPGVPTLPETLRESGYLTGVLGKTKHTLPSRRATAFDVAVPGAHLESGRSRTRYREETAAFLRRAKEEGKPFFLNVNAQDPHRPFAGSLAETKRRLKLEERAEAGESLGNGQYGGGFPEETDRYEPRHVEMPAFLPNLPEVRRELAQYFTSVRRADEVLGGVLDVLEAEGFRDDTIVVFLSDHGMPLPFAKTNCWPRSTLTPLLVRWPGRVEAGRVEPDLLVSTIDLAPTLLEAVGLPPLVGADGRSFLGALTGETPEVREALFTQINTTSAKKSFAMRAVVGRDYHYIWNGWHDGETRMANAVLGGLSYPAMRRAAKSDPALAARLEFYFLRQPEELYALPEDRSALHDSSADPASAATLAEARGLLLRHMTETSDPQLASYRSFLAELGIGDPGEPRVEAAGD